VLQRFDALHRKLHAWQPSELDRLNAAFASGSEKATVDPELARILEAAKYFSLQNNELFNPAIGNLIRLWGFHGDRPPGTVPDKAEIDRLVAARPSMQDIHIEHTRVWSDNPAVRIDLGGYAKGYALDLAVLILKQQGIRNALVNIGGNVIALGKHGDRAWKVGIQHPRKAGVIATLDLHDGEAIGTSGDYQRYFEADGKRHCHLIDPRTGWPASGMQSVTLLVSGHGAGVKSDVLTKPLFIGNASQLAVQLDRFGLNQLLAIDSTGKVLASDAMLKRLQWREAGQTYHLLPHPALR
jgi:thiamine biosynthesis lipoprotein